MGVAAPPRRSANTAHSNNPTVKIVRMQQRIHNRKFARNVPGLPRRPAEWMRARIVPVLGSSTNCRLWLHLAQAIVELYCAIQSSA
jgi:hypothetical protein